MARPGPMGMPGRLARTKGQKMPKMKTKSSAKKRFRLTAKGKVCLLYTSDAADE